MSNKTFIPAFQCNVGDWKYYICMMKYGEVARQVNFAYELGANEELGQLIQRGISSRTKGITEYLIKSPHRFLGSLVVAAWGGEPEYTRLSMDDPDGMLNGLDREFGVLTFDGTQQYFALDGQHRLKAIKDAIKVKPEIGKEDICVLLVTHYDTGDGRLRTRRLFTNINRNAKVTGVAENIALEEDDAFAVLTRRLLEDHVFLKQPGRVRVILSHGTEGELKLASGSVPKTDATALTTFTVLYDMIHSLAWDQPSILNDETRRPSDSVLDEAYKVVSERLDQLFVACGRVRERLEACSSARELRAPKDAEGTGHPFMRPVIQKAIARVASHLMVQKSLDWATFLDRLAKLPWQLSETPWNAVFSTDGGKMLSGKENTLLLEELLKIHICPLSMQQIKRARKNYKDVRGINYPISDSDLGELVVATTANGVRESDQDDHLDSN
jgi:DNA sulfur modification protein DndB